eukprot:gene31481-38879_t
MLRQRALSPSAKLAASGSRDAARMRILHRTAFSCWQMKQRFFNDYRPVPLEWQCHGWSSHLGAMTIEQPLRPDDRRVATELNPALSASLRPAPAMQFAPAWQKLGQFDHMLDAARQASRLQPEHHGVRLRMVECLIYCAETGLAIKELAELESTPVSPETLQAIAQMYQRCARFTDAARCYEKAVALRPGCAPYLFNLASHCVALGEHQRAGALFGAVIERDPENTAAWLNRSLLRAATQASNDTSRMTALLLRFSPGDKAQIPLYYALAKEFDDLGDYEQSFAFLERGARARRASLSYQVESDIAAIEQTKKSFGARTLASATHPGPDESSTFVLGLPRSGATQVVRVSGARCASTQGV